MNYITTRIFKRLTEEQRQELIDKYDVDDIISILEPEIEELIDILEEWILNKLEDFELDSYEQHRDDNDSNI